MLGSTVQHTTPTANGVPNIYPYARRVLNRGA